MGRNSAEKDTLTNRTKWVRSSYQFQYTSRDNILTHAARSLYSVTAPSTVKEPLTQRHTHKHSLYLHGSRRVVRQNRSLRAPQRGHGGGIAIPLGSPGVPHTSTLLFAVPPSSARRRPRAPALSSPQRLQKIRILRPRAARVVIPRSLGGKVRVRLAPSMTTVSQTRRFRYHPRASTLPANPIVTPVPAGTVQLMMVTIIMLLGNGTPHVRPLLHLVAQRVLTCCCTGMTVPACRPSLDPVFDAVRLDSAIVVAVAVGAVRAVGFSFPGRTGPSPPGIGVVPYSSAACPPTALRLLSHRRASSSSVSVSVVVCVSVVAV